MIRHAIFHETGQPETVVRLQETEVSALAPGDVRVRMQFAPVNPADINYLQGAYGKKATLPATPGMEGVGEIVELSSEVVDLNEGDQVILHNHIGAWSEQVCVAREHVIPIRPSIDPQQAAMLRVNPSTAWRLLTGYRSLESGDSIIQNAANSGVGLAVIQLAKILGIQTLNVVRRESAMDVCRTAGAKHLFLDERGLKVDAEPILAFNAVGGDSALRLMELLAPEGIHITYGAMARQALKVPNRFLIFKQIQLHGLWVTKWMNALSMAERQSLFDRLASFVREGKLALPVERVYPLDQVAAGVTHAQTNQRGGKVMIDLRR